ncbi:PH domain-containing protein [Actinoalloteichus hymeniacidonis]|uniref:Membrane protein n=1 Tax=Actinoalloteichus hymeniacidonis TaxID=340345 RepID=A0AAC9HN25_9PSEU|nr:PH domain-containing protein [Actinoalloteichus hymeniacidonis]AOS62216.1 putative membrane protein [Actinoalloteichus hymeniacidonis]MBB5909759.1 putative membrane protein [Actinoalloteichus hymeniacidonis]
MTGPDPDHTGEPLGSRPVSEPPPAPMPTTSETPVEAAGPVVADPQPWAASPAPPGDEERWHPGRWQSGPAQPPPPEAEMSASEQIDQRLDARMLAVRPLNEAMGLLPVLIIAMVVGSGGGWQLPLAAAGAGLLLINGFSQWLTTRYRISDDQVFLRSGWLFRTRRAVPRDRIRTVDLTAKVMHRVFGVVTVKIGTGGRKGAGMSDELVLDSVSRAEAERLRQVLLHRAPVGSVSTPVDSEAPDGVAADPTASGATAQNTTGEEPGTVLSKLDPRWLRFAPLTLAGLTAVGVLAGVSMQWLQELSIDVDEVGLVRDWVGWLSEAPIALLVVGIVLALFVISSVLALIVYAIRNWNYLLTRETDGTLRVRRGLLTTRAVSLEEKRLRGVELQEPLLLRSARGGQVNAVAVGISMMSPESSQLLPPAPVTEAHRVAAAVAKQDHAPTRSSLSRHPAAALSRRLVRAVVPVAVLAAALWALTTFGSWPSWPAWTATGLLPFAVFLGVDRYRSLGHALGSRYLVTRYGSLSRNTVALERDGIIGWNIRRTIFQRSAGLVTLTATTAAGGNSYDVVDVAEPVALGVADEAVPALLQPFLIGGNARDHRESTHRQPVPATTSEDLNSST